MDSSPTIATTVTPEERQQTTDGAPETTVTPTIVNKSSFLELRSILAKHRSGIPGAIRSLSGRSLSNPELNENICETLQFFVNTFSIRSKKIEIKIETNDRETETNQTTINSQQTQTDKNGHESSSNELNVNVNVNGNDEDVYCEIPAQISVPIKPSRKPSKRSVKSNDTGRTSASSSKCDNSGYSQATTATSTFADDDDDDEEEAVIEEDEYDEFDDDCDESSSGGYFERDSLPRPPLPTNSRFDNLFRGKEIKDLPKNGVSVKRRAKESFRQFMKMNKIASNKLLSIRLRDAQGTLRKKIFSFAAFDALHRHQRHKSKRPTREPPPPPILVFRPAAPEPTPTATRVRASSSSSSSLLSSSLFQTIGNDEDTISELYHDSFLPENDSEEAIYSCVEETQQQQQQQQHNGTSATTTATATTPGDNDEEDPYDGTALSGSTYEMNGYYDDGECIYEELSSPEDDDDGTVYEDYFDDDEDEQTYGNVEDLKTTEQKEKEQAEKEIKRIKKMAKMMKKFQLHGDEVPINSGIIVSDRRGSRNNLFVRQGETVLIIRMDGNPPGKWLAKNERSKLGYVDPDNVVFDTESIAAVIKSFHNL